MTWRTFQPESKFATKFHKKLFKSFMRLLIILIIVAVLIAGAYYYLSFRLFDRETVEKDFISGIPTIFRTPGGNLEVAAFH